MKPADFALLFAVCLVWALNLVFTRWAMADAEIPPVFFAGLRLGLVAVLLSPFLLPAPRQLGLMFLIAMGMGAVHFALLFAGLANASASAASVIGQLGVPITTLMSMAFLGERIGWPRGIGIVMSFAGVMIIAVDPAGMSLTVGLAYLLAAAFAASAANILMKRIEPMPAMRLQAWIGLFSVAPLFVVSGLTETGQAAPYLAGDWRVWAATAFAVVAVSIFGHGSYYRMLKRYDVSLISPLTLMTPVMGVALGVAMLGEPLSWRLAIGAAVSLAGVGLILIRGNRRFPDLPVGDRIGQ